MSMSPTDPNMPGIKGKRVPGRPGRFDPSEPLHMTTRRSAKTRPNDGSPSINGSIDGDESRRGSLDDQRPLTSHSNGSQFSFKSRRPSEVSVPNMTPDVVLNGLSIPQDKPSGESISIPLSPVQQTPSPSRKRKRSSSPTGHEAIQLPQPMENTIDTPFANDAVVSDYELDGDTVEVVAEDELSDREVSRHGSQSDEEGDLRNDAFIRESMDVTPAVSNPGSPESGESGSPEKLSLEGTLEDIGQDAQDEAAEVVEEMDVDVDVDVDADVDAEGADDADDAEEQLRSDEDERPVRRFGGRRRAQHPIPKVEKAMQRQAELKSAYRALARAQKAVLAEIAQRTVDDLEINPELHTQTFEYQGVRDGLDDALEERQYHLRAQLELNMKQLQETLESQQRALKERCEQRLRDLKEDRLAELECEMMRIVREAQKTSVDDGYLTDNEDGVISKSKTIDSERNGTNVVTDVYDSRTRLALETIRTTSDMETRFEMHKLLEGLDEEDRIARPKDFTIMDDTPRKAAAARREGLENGKILAKAALEFERRSKKPIILNKDAFGLQLLGDLASRPSFMAPTRDYTTGKQRKGSMSQHTPSRPVPPQIQIPTNHRPSPIPVEMSPRTTQAMGDRFETSMPPPVTPRQRTTLFMRSPEAIRPEQTLPSPTFNANRFNAPQEYPVRTPDRWPGSRTNTYSDSNRPQPEAPKQSEQRQDAQFSPPQSNERGMEYPLWREYPREVSAQSHRRSSSHGERPPFNLSAGVPLRAERPSGNDIRVQQRQELQDKLSNESLPQGLLHIRPPYWRDQPSQPGAAENQTRDQRSPNEPPRRPTLEAQSSYPRNPSISFTPREFRPGSLQVKDNNPDRQKPRTPKNIFSHKTSKEERDGMSRRNWSNQRRFSKSLGSFRSNESPTNISSAGSPVERTQPSAPWRGPPAPQHSPPTVPPPPAPYQQSPYSQPPPPSTYRPTQQSSDYYQHRTSFTPRPATSNPDRLPPTPLYVVPQQQHPPPPGVPPEQYNRPFAPPPPPGYQPPPQPPPQAPQSAYPQSTSGTSYSNQYGGTPLAPAGNTYHPLGARPTPAFAQQAQQQHQGSFGTRRRTQSDASQLPKFQSWTPPTRGR